MSKKNNPVAVLISDIHYSIHTLKLADNALRQAISKSNELRVPLIIAGDLHDSKANLRAECVNALLKTFETCGQPIYLVVGNHCKINNNSDQHALNFLRHLSIIVDYPMYIPDLGIQLIPYFHDPDQLRVVLSEAGKGSTIIMHQGIEGSNSGDYIQDKSAINHSDVKDFRVISGHYHTRQDIKTGRPQKGSVGLFSYIGNPFTLNFGESRDPEKGFQVLNRDGSLTFVPTNLRKHILIECTTDDLSHNYTINTDDLVQVRLIGTRESIDKLTKKQLKDILDIPGNFILDTRPTDIRTSATVNPNLSKADTLDNLIDSLEDSSMNLRQRLKLLWKNL